jgi:hypothetical protein
MGRVDLTGVRFGRWTVIVFALNTPKGAIWLCRCDCGESVRCAPTTRGAAGARAVVAGPARWAALAVGSLCNATLRQLPPLALPPALR